MLCAAGIVLTPESRLLPRSRSTRGRSGPCAEMGCSWDNKYMSGPSLGQLGPIAILIPSSCIYQAGIRLPGGLWELGL